MKTSARTVRVARHFDFPLETVFDAWVEPNAVCRWLFRTPEGVLKKTLIGPREGGKFEITEQRGDMLVRHVGEYVEIDRPHRLVFDFTAGAEGETLPPMTRVTVEIEPDGDGSMLTLTHEGVWDEYAERTEAGWTKLLGNLAATLGEEKS